MTKQPTADSIDQRHYWSSQLDDAHAFMMQVLDYPVAECGEPLVLLDPAAKAAGVEVVFSRAPHVHGLPRLHALRQGQLGGFLQAAGSMNQRGWILRVEDGYRNRPMQKFVGRQPIVFDAILRKVLWECNGKTPAPEFMFKRVLTLSAQMPKIGTHMSGSAIDISVLDRSTGKEVDRGAPYLEMSELTPMNSPFIGDGARANRQAITDIMRAAGFVEYPYEFWHYNSGDAYDAILRRRSGAAVYGPVDWDPHTGRMVPVPDPLAPLNSLKEIEAEMDAALARLRNAETNMEQSHPTGGPFGVKES